MAEPEVRKYDVQEVDTFVDRCEQTLKLPPSSITRPAGSVHVPSDFQAVPSLGKHQPLLDCKHSLCPVSKDEDRKQVEDSHTLDVKVVRLDLDISHNFSRDISISKVFVSRVCMDCPDQLVFVSVLHLVPRSQHKMELHLDVTQSTSGSNQQADLKTSKNSQRAAHNNSQQEGTNNSHEAVLKSSQQAASNRSQQAASNSRQQAATSSKQQAAFNSSQQAASNSSQQAASNSRQQANSDKASKRVSTVLYFTYNESVIEDANIYDRTLPKKCASSPDNNNSNNCTVFSVTKGNHSQTVNDYMMLSNTGFGYVPRGQSTWDLPVPGTSTTKLSSHARDTMAGPAQPRPHTSTSLTALVDQDSATCTTHLDDTSVHAPSLSGPGKQMRASVDRLQLMSRGQWSDSPGSDVDPSLSALQSLLLHDQQLLAFQTGNQDVAHDIKIVRFLRSHPEYVSLTRTSIEERLADTSGQSSLPEVQPRELIATSRASAVKTFRINHSKLDAKPCSVSGLSMAPVEPRDSPEDDNSRDHRVSNIWLVRQLNKIQTLVLTGVKCLTGFLVTDMRLLLKCVAERVGTCLLPQDVLLVWLAAFPLCGQADDCVFADDLPGGLLVTSICLPIVPVTCAALLHAFPGARLWGWGAQRHDGRTEKHGRAGSRGLWAACLSLWAALYCWAGPMPLTHTCQPLFRLMALWHSDRALHSLLRS